MIPYFDEGNRERQDLSAETCVNPLMRNSDLQAVGLILLALALLLILGRVVFRIMMLIIEIGGIIFALVLLAVGIFMLSRRFQHR